MKRETAACPLLYGEGRWLSLSYRKRYLQKLCFQRDGWRKDVWRGEGKSIEMQEKMK